MNFFADIQILGAVNIWQATINFFANSIEWLFKLTYNLGIPSYLLAILIFTIIIRILLQPLMSKQMRSTRKMQMLAPEIEEIKKRYASNPQKQQQATMELYKEHGASPTAGCLPLLIQMPILYALFAALRNFGIEGSIHPIYPEYFQFWVWKDLAMVVKDATYPYLLPILASLTTLFQQLLTTTNRQDRTQRMMLIIFPIMFMFFTLNFPVLMAFYWIFYSLISSAIMYPMLTRWTKKDKAEIEEKRAKRAAEEEEKRAKKAALKEAYYKGKPRKASKPGAPGQEDDFLDEDDSPEEGIEGESDADVDPEKLFRKWLQEKGYTIRKKKMKLHPYSVEAEIVELVFDENGQEKSMEALHREYSSAQKLNQAASLGDMFGFPKRKNKKSQKSTTDLPVSSPKETEETSVDQDDLDKN